MYGIKHFSHEFHKHAVRRIAFYKLCIYPRVGIGDRKTNMVMVKCSRINELL